MSYEIKKYYVMLLINQSHAKVTMNSWQKTLYPPILFLGQDSYPQLYWKRGSLKAGILRKEQGRRKKYYFLAKLHPRFCIKGKICRFYDFHLEVFSFPSSPLCVGVDSL